MARPEAMWDAITKPEFSARYFYGSRVETTGEVGSPSPKATSRPASSTGAGWMLVLSGLKTVLETGATLARR